MSRLSWVCSRGPVISCYWEADLREGTVGLAKYREFVDSPASAPIYLVVWRGVGGRQFAILATIHDLRLGHVTDQTLNLITPSGHSGLSSNPARGRTVLAASVVGLAPGIGKANFAWYPSSKLEPGQK